MDGKKKTVLKEMEKMGKHYYVLFTWGRKKLIKKVFCMKRKEGSKS